MRPALPEAAVAWELRTAWAKQRDVGLSLRGGRRVRGYVVHVAPSGAFALVWDGTGDLHVPTGVVLAVHRPHYHEPEWGAPVAPPMRGPAIPVPMAGQLALW